MMVLGAIYPVGAVVEGAIAHAVGIREVTAVSGGVLFTVMVALGLFRGQLFAALENSPTFPYAPGDASGDDLGAWVDPAAPVTP